MKVVTIIGARPQFIKAAVVSRKLRKENEEIIIHTGQHYDENMSEIFFRELSIPKPDYNLNINGKSHGEMTGEMLIEIEKLLLKLKPDAVLVYGDTNSTLAGALAAVKLQIPVCHVEAGNRLNTLTNPEEINRVITDRVSTLLLCSVESSVENLKKEGLIEGVSMVGDPMYDAFELYSRKKEVSQFRFSSIAGDQVSIPSEYYFLTCHREENSNDRSLNEILSALQDLDAPVIFPVHPRVKRIVENMNLDSRYNNIKFINPVGYVESITLVKNAKKVITDSGGVQREAFFAGVQCVTIFDYVVWPETMVYNRNQLTKPEKDDILNKLAIEQTVNPDYQPFGDGNSGQKIVDEIVKLGKKEV